MLLDMGRLSIFVSLAFWGFAYQNSDVLWRGFWCSEFENERFSIFVSLVCWGFAYQNGDARLGENAGARERAARPWAVLRYNGDRRCWSCFLKWEGFLFL